MRLNLSWIVWHKTGLKMSSVLIVLIGLFKIGATQLPETHFILTLSYDVICTSSPYLSVTSLIEDHVSVVVHSPLCPEFQNINTTVDYREWRVLTLPPHAKMKKCASDSLEIVSSGPIQVYFSQSDQCMSDNTGILPTGHLDTLYMPHGWMDTNVTTAITRIGLTTLYNGTEITVPLAHSIEISQGDTKLGPGQTLRRTLNYLETMWFDSYDDLTGLRIEASKPVAVFQQMTYPCSGEEDLHSNDILENSLTMLCGYQSFEQLRPVSRWGKRYLTFPFADEGDLIHVYAADDDTNVVVAGETKASTFNLSVDRGIELHLSTGDYISIESDKPVMVLQYSHEGCSDLTGEEAKYDHCLNHISVPPVTSTGGRLVAGHTLRKKKSSDKMNFVVKSSEAERVTMNDLPILRYNDSNFNLSLYATYDNYALYRLAVSNNDGVLLRAPPGVHFIIMTPSVSLQYAQDSVSGGDVSSLRSGASPKASTASTQKSGNAATSLPVVSSTRVLYEILNKPSKVDTSVKEIKPHKNAKQNAVLKFLTDTVSYGNEDNFPLPRATDVPFVVKEAKQNDVINFHQAAPGNGWNSDNSAASGGLDMTVIAVIISLASAIVLVIMCVVGFLMAEYVCRRDLFSSAKVSPYIE